MVVPGFSSLQKAKKFEHFFLICLANANPRVLHRNLDVIFGQESQRPTIDEDLSIFIRELESVRNQVQHNLLDPVLVGDNIELTLNLCLEWLEVAHNSDVFPICLEF
jgi:hypothetical protein